ncbi:unnamed protein product [Thelazia callipaeda]|uniref:PDZ domain-containing protein n=1 Tax=Thelazia callipaeda TaxID=103827 RepID=A0A0N5CK05_THECL|nr:unnamed protein product [Thelazia callipaeda]
MFSWSLSNSSATLKSVKSLSSSTSSFGRTFLENFTRSSLYYSLTSLDKTNLWSKFYVEHDENIQKVLDVVSVDQKVITNPNANKRRRTVMVTRTDGQAFGFTLQTYLLKRKDEDVPSKVTYVDYVQLESPAADAGIRAGDVIISINGLIVTEMGHESLIRLISSCHQMRMIVIFENIRQRIELVARTIKLRKILNDKLYQLNLIDIEEQKILNRAYLRSLSAQKKLHSLTDSLSSAGTSSISSASLTPSEPGEIRNDPRPCVIRIPTIMIPNRGTGIEANKNLFGKQISDPAVFLNASSLTQPTNLTLSRRSKVKRDEVESEEIQQRISYYGSDLEDFDHISTSSNVTAEISDIPRICEIFCDNNVDDSEDISYNSFENNDCENYEGSSDNGSAEFADDNDSTSPLQEVRLSEFVFDSVALNHVIRLDNGVISSQNNNSEKSRFEVAN